MRAPPLDYHVPHILGDTQLHSRNLSCINLTQVKAMMLDSPFCNFIYIRHLMSSLLNKKVLHYRFILLCGPR